MKGRNPSAEQKAYWSLLAEHIGCIACYRETIFGERNHLVSIHHVDGRTKPNAHWFVLPLCAGHHQDGTGQPEMIAVHPYKARFESRYGSQQHLMRECATQLQEQGLKVPKTLCMILGIEHD